MAVIPLVLGRTVATSEEDFQSRGGRNGSTLLIRNFDVEQLVGTAPNLSYDLRIWCPIQRPQRRFELGCGNTRKRWVP